MNSSTLAIAPRLPSAALPAHHQGAPRGGAAPVFSGFLTALIGLLGLFVGAAAIFHTFASVRVGWLLPLVGIQLTLTPLGGFFMATTGAVAVPVGVYTVGYARREQLAHFPLFVLPAFVAAMLLVPAAGSVTTFLFGWELMAGASLALVLTDHRRAAAREAGLVYAILTQLGFAAILVAFVILAAAGGADTFAGLAANTVHISGASRNIVFLLTLVGFGSKAGLIPLHAWLPRAHPEAPSPVSALMSAAMVNLGIYGILRVDLQLLGPVPRWWGLVLLTVGAGSAVFGVLHASVATDLKRLLAYSTTENMGLIVVALGAATLLSSAGAGGIAAIAMTAALLHVLAHAAFKALAFLAAGSVLASTGLRDLDKMGGLSRTMPVTSVLFGIAALGACGLPLGAGFVSEWLLVQALIHAPHGGNAVLSLSLPLAIGAVALTTGLGVAAMVKAFGIGFLGRARTTAAAEAREAPASMLVGMAIAALACVLLAVAPMLVGSALQRVLAALPSTGRDQGPRLGAFLRLPGAAGSIAPGWLALGLVAATVLSGFLMRWNARRRPAPVTSPLWASGANGLSSRMQYTATSFAEPLQRVFDDVLRPDIDVEVSHYDESHYLVQKVAFRARQSDAIEEHLYVPVVSAIRTWADWVRRVHSGSVHRYVAFGAFGLLVVLIVAR